MEDQNNPLERMKNLDNVLDEYEHSAGLSKYIENKFNDVEKYLEMSKVEMNALSLEECSQIAIILGSFALHIQRTYNREIARINWAENTIRKMISGKEKQYQGSWESQYYQAIKESPYASDLLKLKTYAQQRADRLTYLASSIKHISDLFINLQRVKMK